MVFLKVLKPKKFTKRGGFVMFSLFVLCVGWAENSDVFLQVFQRVCILDSVGSLSTSLKGFYYGSPGYRGFDSLYMSICELLVTTSTFQGPCFWKQLVDRQGKTDSGIFKVAPPILFKQTRRKP